MSPEYLKAIEEHNAALAVMHKVTLDYRAKLIDDAEYLAARAVMKQADAAFDSAFAKEQGDNA